MYLQLGHCLLFIHFWQLLLHGRIPMILDGIVGPAVQVFCYFGPPVAERLMREEEHPFLMITPVLLLDIWI